jgi:hypothetical protein
MEREMPRLLVRLSVPVLVVVLMFGGAGLARAALDELALAQSLTSATPGMLGPINSLGRTGWDCAPEKAARASRAGHAELPDDASR